MKNGFLWETSNSEPQGGEKPPLELPKPEGARLVQLPRKFSVPEVNLSEAIAARKSLREYSEKKLSLEELSYLLWCTQGVKEVIENKATFRTVPSAGARHALETLLLVNKVESIEPGLYRFLALEHVLAQINQDPGLREKIAEACLSQQLVKNSAATFIWTAVTRRMTYRYGKRGFRYLFLDAGHVCQNLYLACEGIECGACALGAFSDEAINSLLNLDGTEQFVIYLAAVGKK